MSKLSFNTFCIEYYSHHINKPSNEVYSIFKISGLLDLINEDLHGMSMEYLMCFFDDYFGGGKEKWLYITVQQLKSLNH